MSRLTALVLAASLSSGCANICKNITEGYVTRPHRVSSLKQEELVEKDGRTYLRQNWVDEIYVCKGGKRAKKSRVKYTALYDGDNLIKE